MIIKNSQSVPTLNYLALDRYPYYIPSILRIETLTAPFLLEDMANVTSDELHIILKGSATYEIILKRGGTELINLKKQDIMFLTGGMQHPIMKSASDDLEILKITFTLYTTSNFYTQSSYMNLSEALKEPVANQPVYLQMPRVTHFHYGDELHGHISAISEAFYAQQTGYILQVQTHLLQLILEILLKSQKKYDDVLINADLIGITSKFTPYALMQKGCILQTSDFEIFDNYPHSHKANLLSRFEALRSYKLNPHDDPSLTSIIVTDNSLPTQEKNSICIKAEADSIYHIWIHRNRNLYTSDFRAVAHKCYLRFYAKCNMEMRFGIVIYNSKNNRYIHYTLNITPSNDYIEYCLPIIENQHAKITSPHIHTIIDYIENNYDKKILLEDIANYVHLNTSYVSYLFKEEVGNSISDYIQNYRLSKAKELLADSKQLAISEIAQAVGFYDSAHFARAFNKKYQISPNEYRKQASK